ncbi:MAG: ferredoxin [Bacteroidetes bacterium]|nr:MAG: ferredoxin [Bacteroidota bacterium]
MAIKKVWVEDGCISCGLCEEVAEDIFEVDDVSEVREGAEFAGHEDEIKEAAEGCPVEVIKFEEE